MIEVQGPFPYCKKKEYNFMEGIFLFDSGF